MLSLGTPPPNILYTLVKGLKKFKLTYSCTLNIDLMHTVKDVWLFSEVFVTSIRKSVMKNVLM